MSHDRAFLDNVVTSTLVFEGDGHVGEYVGGYEDWLRQRKPAGERVKREAPEPRPVPEAQPKEPSPAGQKRKLSYKETRELETLPGKIEQLEREQQQLESSMSQAAFYQQEKTAIAQTLARAEALRAELASAYARWEELERGA